MSDSEHSLSSGELAQLLDADVKTLHNWHSRGKLPAHRTPGGHYRFYPSEVRQAYEAQGLRLPKPFAAFLAERAPKSKKGGAS